MIGIFDSGYGGLTILQQIRKVLPGYDYLYLGDNARAPYGTRSFDCIYHYTLDAVRFLFSQGCTLIILACNTASAKALRTIQQHDLPLINDKMVNDKMVNVLGVIRPTVEVVPSITRTGHVGILATPATVSSESYVLELDKIASTMYGRSLNVTQQPCPMWVPLIEAGEHNSDGAKYFISKYLQEILTRDPLIDTLLLGCTHYPLIKPAIDAELAHFGYSCQTIAQGEIVAHSLADYLRRHPEYATPLTRNECSDPAFGSSNLANQSQTGSCRYLTTDDADRFSSAAALFLGHSVQATHVEY